MSAKQGRSVDQWIVGKEEPLTAVASALRGTYVICFFHLLVLIASLNQ
jgi:hypothetical protein